MSFSRIILFALLGGLVLGGVYTMRMRSFHGSISVTKLPDGGGGSYSISGSGYHPSEAVSLEIKNAPLASPGGWQLGMVQAVEGKFLFQTEKFRCVHVDDVKLREQYAEQRVIFVATGLSSGMAATRVETAGGIFVCSK